MSLSVTLPRGCSSSRGVSDIHRLSSEETGLVGQTNRLYMLTVRRKSLLHKKHSFLSRLSTIENQLSMMERDIGTTEKRYKTLKGGPVEILQKKTVPLRF